MKSLTLEDEQNHAFDKHEAQLLIIELCTFLAVLKTYCESFKEQEPVHYILVYLDYVTKLTGRLYFELDATDVEW